MQAKRLFTTIDTHTGGEPLRIITGGIPPLPGATMLEKRAYVRQYLDEVRRVLMYEPRGHHGMYGCVITPPVHEDADFGVLFMHNEGFSTMCGHGVIAVVKAVLETGYLQLDDPSRPIVIDSPAGTIVARATWNAGEVAAVSFENVPSFVYAQDVALAIAGKRFTVDVAFGGAFYAIVQAKDLGVKVEVAQLPVLQQWAWEIKRQLEGGLTVVHPLEPELRGIYGVIISDEPQRADSTLRNVTIFADAQIDRSPCGTGTAARLAVLYQRGLLREHERFVHEGIVGSQFVGEVLRTTQVAQFPAIVPRIEGKAFVTGLHQFMVDPTDPLAAGFLLR